MPWWIQILGGGLIGAAIALLKYRLDRTAAERTAFADLPGAISRAVIAEEALDVAQRELRALRQQVSRVPTALIAGRLEDLNGLARWFDGFVELIVASSAESGGTIIYVNPAFCAALGRPKEDILGSAWKALLHPDDARRTRSVEAAAWYDPVQNFGNRYRHTDGRWIALVWNCDVYAKGLTLCRVEVGGEKQ